jgi:periplasmic glucans biosynthesis protein
VRRANSGRRETSQTGDAAGASAVTFSPGLFNYGRNKFADKIPAELGFAGFRLTYPFYRSSEFNQVIVFAGASYFRAVARGQLFGLSAGGLAIDTAVARGHGGEKPFILV